MKPVSRRMLDWFHLYLRWYVPRHFHAVRAADFERFQLAQSGTPTIVILNHPGWWDPLIAMLLARCAWGSRVTSYAPMDAVAMRQYGIFKHLGLFPVEMESPNGGRRFLRDSQWILSDTNRVLWLTPQGSFRDTRATVLNFRRGLGLLLHRMPQARVLPVALEYTFWDERLPEALILCGKPLDVHDGAAHSGAEWTELAEERMAATQRELAGLAMARDAAPFTNLFHGASGTGGIYDLWRRARAASGGEAYQPEHGALYPTGAGAANKAER